MLDDDITRAVLERDEVVRYLQGSHGPAGPELREKVYEYLDELRTTQRYPIYRALKHPLYPILRKIDRFTEHIERVEEATRAGRVIYASNHRSHLDYLVEPLALEDVGIRPPIIAAGINLFGGPLGLIHRHVTGAMPIRRNTKDPAYLITLKAYVAELLGRHDLMFYPEGGRSYSGELKPPKTGLLHAALQGGQDHMVIVPCAVAYDLVLEDHILSRQRVKRAQRPFGREFAELVRYAVGYRSRAYVTFGTPIDVSGCDPHSRREVLDLAHRVRDDIGRLVKVLPTSLLATVLRHAMTQREAEIGTAALIDRLLAAGANIGDVDPREAVDRAARSFEARNIIVIESGRFRVRERNVLRFYARSIEHLLPVPPDQTH
jgi:glycerol-3-phosphate O-acyltransferase